ncbi:DUF1398 domain-containing protein [Flavobacterium hauense]
MFTIDQIKNAHSKVKSGADFPQYIQDIKALGVTDYSTFVTDGHSIFCGDNDHMAQSPVKYETLEIAETSSVSQLGKALKVHQAGGTDYMTFCRQAASAGVEKWVTDITRMTCTYYDIAGNALIVEDIPQA